MVNWENDIPTLSMLSVLLFVWRWVDAWVCFIASAHQLVAKKRRLPRSPFVIRLR